MKIGHKTIGGDHPCFIIAELSANHNGNLEVAIETIRAAKKTGADAIKLQTYTPDTLTINCDNEYFRIEGGTLGTERPYMNFMVKLTHLGNGTNNFLK